MESLANGARERLWQRAVGIFLYVHVVVFNVCVIANGQSHLSDDLLICVCLCCVFDLVVCLSCSFTSSPFHVMLVSPCCFSLQQAVGICLNGLCYSRVYVCASLVFSMIVYCCLQRAVGILEVLSTMLLLGYYSYHYYYAMITAKYY